MARDRHVSRREELLRLLDEIERIPQRPVGRHLDEEDLIGLAQESLCTERETEVLEHLQSCAECAEDVLNVSDVLEEAAKARAAAAAARAVGLVWMVAATAVWVARHKKGGIVRLSGSAAGSDQRVDSPKFEWAIAGSGGDRFLRIRTRDEEWRGRPVHCIVYDTRTDRNVAEEWVMLFANDDEGYTYGEAPFRTGAPTSNLWRAEVRGYESFDRLPPESVETLRKAFSHGEIRRKLGGLGAEEGRAWEAWLEREVAGGRLTLAQLAAFIGRKP